MSFIRAGILKNMGKINPEQLITTAENLCGTFVKTSCLIGTGVGAITLPIATYKEFKKENNIMGMVATPLMVPVGAIGGAGLGLTLSVITPVAAVVVVGKSIQQVFAL